MVPRPQKQEKAREGRGHQGLWGEKGRGIGRGEPAESWRREQSDSRVPPSICSVWRPPSLGQQDLEDHSLGTLHQTFWFRFRHSWGRDTAEGGRESTEQLSENRQTEWKSAYQPGYPASFPIKAPRRNNTEPVTPPRHTPLQEHPTFPKIYRHQYLGVSS